MTDEKGSIDLEWEEWDPQRISFHKHMLAGSIAGLSEHVSIFPIDTLKTHIQCERCGSTSPLKLVTCANRIIKREGILRLWRGVSATFAGCIPAHAAYFSIYEAMKIVLGVDNHNHRPVHAALSGATATIAHDSIITPFDVVKQRMQLGYYKSILHCMTETYKHNGGLRAFYASLPTTLFMNIPYGGVMVSVNESCKQMLNPDGNYSFVSTMLSGSFAGFVAAAVTNPLDVIKTRLQTQNIGGSLDPANDKDVNNKNTNNGNNNRGPSGPCKGSSVSNNYSPISPAACRRVSKPALHELNLQLYGTRRVFQALPVTSTKSLTRQLLTEAAAPTRNSFTSAQIFTQIIKEEGVRGLWRGVVPRVCVHTPAVAISWTAYETAKMILDSVA